MSKREYVINISCEDPSQDNSSTPEQKLWVAVIEKTVQDFRDLFDRVSRQIARMQTYNAHFFYEYKTFKYELEHQFFDDICEFAGFPRDKLLKVFNAEARASGLFDYQQRAPQFKSSQARRIRGWH